MEINRHNVAKTILKKTKLKDSHSAISKLTTKPQQSRECGTGIKIDIDQWIEMRVQK